MLFVRETTSAREEGTPFRTPLSACESGRNPCWSAAPAPASRCLRCRPADGEDRSSPPREDDGALDRVLQLSDIAGPTILGERRPSARCDGREGSAFAGESTEKILDEEREIAGTFSERRDGDVEHVEAVVKIFAEHACDDALLEIAMCRGEDTHINVYGRVCSKWLDLGLCRTRKSLACAIGGISAISSRKSVLVGGTETAEPRPNGAGECAAFMSEKLGLEERLRKAAQLTATNGPFARALWSWILRATSSLPVPLSPVMSTGRRFEA